MPHLTPADSLLGQRRPLSLSTTRKTFTVAIRASRLRSGSHRITVTASDLAGNRAVRSLRFRRCAG
jgi:hypothetical protein